MLNREPERGPGPPGNISLHHSVSGSLQHEEEDRTANSTIKTNTVLCVHSNALHQCDIINATGVTENSDTISLCFFLLLQMCVKLPEQG